MFKINNLHKISKFSFVLEDLLKPFWNLASDILSVKDVLKEFAPNVYEKAKDYNFESDSEKDKEKASEASTSGFIDYVKGLTNSLLDKESLKAITADSSILLIYQDPTNAEYYFIEGPSAAKESASESLKRYIIIKNIIANFLRATKNDDLKNLASIESPILYSKVVTKSESLVIEMPVIPVDFLDLTDKSLEYNDVDFWWANYSRLIKDYYHDFPREQEKIQSIVADSQTLGVKVGNYCFLTMPLWDNDDATFKYLKKDRILDYVWLCFKHNVLYESSRKDNQQITEGSEDISNFLDACKKDDFVNEMSCLCDNLYIDKSDISEECKMFFDRMLKIHDLKKFETFNFYIDEPEDEGATVFGLYQKVKLDTDYNLKYLLENKGGKLCDKIIPSIKKEAVWVLKPKIAQFFLRDFFERLLFSALKELNDKGIEGYLPNYFAQWNNGGYCELDALARTKNSLWFIEAKTTLTISLINNYVKKCRKIASNFKEINDNLHFMIVGYFSNPELEIFKNASLPGDKIPDDYNKKRDGLQNTPYYFEVPVDDYPVHNLICFTEPSYNKLKDTLSQTFER